MRKKLLGKALSVILSATLALSPSVTAFAEEGVAAVPVEDTEQIDDAEVEDAIVEEDLGAPEEGTGGAAEEAFTLLGSDGGFAEDGAFDSVDDPVLLGEVPASINVNITYAFTLDGKTYDSAKVTNSNDALITDVTAAGTTKTLTDPSVKDDSDAGINGKFFTFTGWTASVGTVTEAEGTWTYATGTLPAFTEDTTDLDVTLTGSFTTNSYVLKYYGIERADGAYTYAAGGVVPVPALTSQENKVGYDFDAWYVGSTSEAVDDAKKLVAPHDDVTTWSYTLKDSDASASELSFYANFIPWPYKIHFNANAEDGVSVSNMPSDITDAEVGTEVEIPSTIPTRKDKDFVGWTGASNGSGVTVEPGKYYSFIPVSKTDNVINLYAQWQDKQTFVVTFNSQNGSTVPSQDVMKGATASVPTAPTRNGYTFGGWFTDKECTSEFNFDTPITANITLYAKWTGWSYHIVFDGNGATDGSTTSKSMVVGTSAKLTKNGYTNGNKAFMEWNTEPDGTGTAYADEAVVDLMPQKKGSTVFDIYLYAQWEDKVTITFNHNDAVINPETGEVTTPATEETISIAKGTAIPEASMVSNPMRTGYVFDGWYLADKNGKITSTKFSATTKFTADTTYLAKWLTARTVTFKLDGGNINASTDDVKFTVGDGKTIDATAFEEAFENLAKDNSLFDDWYKVETPEEGAPTVSDTVKFNIAAAITADATYQAKWKDSVNVTFNLNGGNIGGVTDAVVVPVVKDQPFPTAKLPADPVRDEKTFGGWYKDASTVFNPSANVTEAITVTAKWLSTYTITFNANGGTFADNSTTKAVNKLENDKLGVAISDVPVKKGHTFKGWATTNNASVADYREDADVSAAAATYYAVWTPITYIVEFNANGGTGAKLDTIQVTYGMETALKPVNSFTMANYTCIGWTVKKYPAGSVAGSDEIVGQTESGGVITRTNKILADKPLADTQDAHVTLYAYWQANPADVTVNYGHDVKINNNGTLETVNTETVTFIYGYAGISSLTHRYGGYNPGYYLEGWYKDSEFQNKVDLTKPYDASYTSIYAKWASVTYTITYHSALVKDATAKKTYTIDKADDTVALDVTKIFANDNNVKNAAENRGLKGWTSTVSGLSLAGTAKEKDVVTAIDTLWGWTPETVTDLANYSNRSMPRAIGVDLYAQWNVDPEKTYQVVFVADSNDADLLAGEYAFEQVGTYGYGHIETAEADEVIVITGNEFIKKGYQLAGFTYKNGSKNVTINAGGSVKNLPTTTDPDTGKKIATLTAVWKPISYAVTYVTDGGKVKSGSLAKTYKYADGLTLPEMQKTGFTFNGWFYNNALVAGNKFDAKEIYGPITLVAAYTPINYTVKFTLEADDKTNGALIAGNNDDVTKNVAYDEAIDLSDPAYAATFNGRTFKNWKVSAEKAAGVKAKSFTAKQSIKGLTALSGTTITLTAVFTNDSYAITYNYNGGKAASKGKYPKNYQTVNTQGTKSVVITNPVKVGYTFDGWDTNDDGVVDIHPAGDAFCKLPVGVNGKLALKAVWSLNDYTIELYKNSGIGSTTLAGDFDVVTDKIIYAEDLAAAARVIDSAKSTIIGFATTPGANKAKFGLTKNYKLTEMLSLADSGNVIKLYAVDGKSEIHYITYNKDGGTLSKEVYTYKTSKSAINLVTAKKAGYRFLGWTAEYDTGLVLDKDGYAIKIKAGYAEDISLTANFVPISYNVTIVPGVDGVKDGDGVAVPKKGILFAKNVGFVSGTGDDGVAFANLPAKATATAWVRPGYTFEGFATDKKGVNIVNSLAGLTSNKAVTLYASWKPVLSQITIDPAVVINNENNNDFDALSDELDEYNTSLTAAEANLLKAKKIVTDDGGNIYGMYNTVIALPKLSVKGFTFLGWADNGASTDVKRVTNKNGTFVTQILKTNQTDITLTPVFAENSYKVMINPNGGMIYNNATRKYINKAVSGGTYLYRDAVIIANDPIASVIDGTYRTGYDKKATFVTLDKAGSKAIDGLSGLVAKNNGTITTYLQWDKNATPVKPVIKSAVLSSDDKVTVQVNMPTVGARFIRVECSSSPKFAYDVEYYYLAEGVDTQVFTGKSGTAYYVRAIQYVGYDGPFGKNSSVKGSYSAIVRAAKGGDITSGRTYTIKFDENYKDATVHPVSDVEHGTKVSAVLSSESISPIRVGYTFDGWYTDAKCSDSAKVTADTTVTSAATYYAKWTIKKFTIKFDVNHDSVAPSQVEDVEYGTKVLAKKPTPDPTRSGYAFVGWYKEAEGTNKVTETEEVTAAATYYAKWTPVYTITYKYTDGSDELDAAIVENVVLTGAPQTHTKGTATTLVSPTLQGYTFGGWYTTVDCSDPAQALTSLGADDYSANITLYGKFTQNP